MGEEILGKNGDGAQLPDAFARDRSAQVEADAQQVVLALQAVAASKLSAAPDARKYTERLTFAMDRLAELKRAAELEGGAFAPARAEVAASILEGHVALAAGFINRTMRSVRRAPGRRQARVQVDEAMMVVDGDLSDETRAA